MATNTSGRFITAIHTLKETTGNGQSYIACDMCVIGTSTYIFYNRITCCTTRYNDVNIARHVGLITCTIQTGNNQIAITYLCLGDTGTAAVALVITTAKHLANLTTSAINLGKAVNAGTSIFLPNTICIIINLLTTVTATKGEADVKSGFNQNVCCRNRGGTATAIHFQNCCLITAINFHMCSLA